MTKHSTKWPRKIECPRCGSPDVTPVKFFPWIKYLCNACTITFYRGRREKH